MTVWRGIALPPDGGEQRSPNRLLFSFLLPCPLFLVRGRQSLRAIPENGAAHRGAAESCGDAGACGSRGRSPAPRLLAGPRGGSGPVASPGPELGGCAAAASGSAPLPAQSRSRSRRRSARRKPVPEPRASSRSRLRVCVNGCPHDEEDSLRVGGPSSAPGTGCLSLGVFSQAGARPSRSYAAPLPVGLTPAAEPRNL